MNYFTFEEDLVGGHRPEREVGGDPEEAGQVLDLVRPGAVQSDVHAVEDVDEDADLGRVEVG